MTAGAALGTDTASGRRSGLLRRPPGIGRTRPYVVFVVPAMAVILAVIVFPWLFTLFMSVHDWKVTGARTFVGLSNYAALASDERFIGAPKCPT